MVSVCIRVRIIVQGDVVAVNMFGMNWDLGSKRIHVMTALISRQAMHIDVQYQANNSDVRFTISNRAIPNRQ